VQWNREAEATSQKADELRAAGHAVEADTFDNLARAALERQLVAENDVRTVQHAIDAQGESVGKLASGLGQLTARLSELQNKRSELAARSRSEHASSQLPEATVSAGILDPASELARFEEKVRREEARIDGHEELAASALDAQFDGLGDRENRAATDDRLAELKAERAMSSARARAREQVSR
jgi:phage shock protein A